MQRTHDIGGIHTVVQIVVEPVPRSGVAVGIDEIYIVVGGVNIVQSEAVRRLDLVHLGLRQLHKRPGLDLRVAEHIAVVGCHTAAGDAIVHLNVLVAGSLRLVAVVDVHINHTLQSAHIGAARRGGLLAGIQTHANTVESVAVIQSLSGQAVVDGLHDRLPQPCRRVGAAAGEVDLFGDVVAAPYGCGVVGGIAAEPPVAVGRRGTGLARDVLSRKDGRAAGAVVRRVEQAVVHIIHSLLAEDLPGLLLIVHHDPAIAVVDLGEQSRLPVNAIVGEGRVGGRHFPHGGTNRQCAQRQRRQTHVGQALPVWQGVIICQGGLSKVILGEAVAVIRTDGVQRPGRNGVDGGNNALIDSPRVLVLPVIVLRPVVAVDIGHGQVFHHRRRGDLAGLKGRGVNGNGLLGRTGLELRLRSLVVGKESRLLPHAAGQSNHVARLVVDDHDGGLELLLTAGSGNVAQVGINRIHLLLHVHVQGGINMVAALLDAVEVDALVVSA